MDKFSVILRGVLSFIALTGLIWLGYLESKGGAEVDRTIYYVLGGCIVGLNGNEIKEIIKYIKSK